MGDFNAAIGNNGGVKNNHPSVNPAGKILLQTLDELKWQIINKLADGDSRTHIDRSNPASSRCLDYIVSNSIQRCQEAVVDNKLQATPYIVNRGDDGPESRKFSDHKTIIARFKMDPAPVKKIVQPPKFITQWRIMDRRLIMRFTVPGASSEKSIFCQSYSFRQQFKFQNDIITC